MVRPLVQTFWFKGKKPVIVTNPSLMFSKASGQLKGITDKRDDLGPSNWQTAA